MILKAKCVKGGVRKFCVYWIYRQVHSIWATVQFNSSQSWERRRLFPQMVPAAHPCHHLWSWHMAGVWSTFVFSQSFKLMHLWFVVAEWPLVILFLWRWDVVSGKSSWSMSLQDSLLQNPFLFLWSEYMSGSFNNILTHTPRIERQVTQKMGSL